MEKKLNQIQYWVLKLIYQVGQGAPSVSLLWDTSCLDMSLRIYKEKVLLVGHIRKLDKNSLAKLIYEEQKLQKWPGLATETSSICSELGIEDCNSTNLEKVAYGKILTEALHKKNEEKLRFFARGKCERISIEEYGRKDYLEKKNIFHIRQQYRSRFGLLDFAGNYRNNKKYLKTGGLCLCKDSREDESHLLSGSCKVYGDLTEGFCDLTNDDELVEFFAAVLSRRDQLDNLQ